MAKSRRAPEEEDRRRPDDEDEPPRRKGRDEADDDEEGADDEPLMPRRKRKSAAAPAKRIVRICGAVALAIMLVILLYWVYSPIGTDYSLLCYFPPETTELQGYDVDACAHNGKLKEVHDMVMANYKNFSDGRISPDCGIGPYDVDKFLCGVAKGNADEEKDLDPQDKHGSLTVIRFNHSVDQGKFITSFGSAASERTSKDGKKYYQFSREVRRADHPEREDDFSFFFPDSRTLVYATTRRELQDAMGRHPGRVVVTGPMRDLADGVDGLYFQASTGWYELNGVSNAVAFSLSFVDESVRDPRQAGPVQGTASWFASNGNRFLYASATLFGDAATAKTVKQKLKESFAKAQIEVYGSEEGRVNIDDPFNPKKKAGAPGGFSGGSGNDESAKAISEALSEYAKTARVYSRGRMVIVEGTISHGMPETGRFEKFFSAVGSKFRVQQPFGGLRGPGFPGGPMGGPGGPPPPPR